MSALDGVSSWPSNGFSFFGWMYLESYSLKTSDPSAMEASTPCVFSFLDSVGNGVELGIVNGEVKFNSYSFLYELPNTHIYFFLSQSWSIPLETKALSRI